MHWVIYFVGYLLCYILIKVYRNKKNMNTFGELGFTVLVSLSSYFGFLIILVMIFNIEKIGEKELPKWLKWL